ncbi:MAG: DUF421 domain-containing protein [Oscillospiraceae bacterium]|nr:DUF421 domain-containing protein [Oscillospiraceae bacterium]
MAISMVRTIIIYAAMVVSMRVMGKRQLGELEPAEFVVAILIADIAASPLSDHGTPLLYGLAPVLTLVFCEVIMSFFVMKSVRFRRLLSGAPSVIIENGKISQAEMKRNRYTLDELAEHLRKNGVTDISSVKYAVLETDGSLSAEQYEADMPVTMKTLGIDLQENPETAQLIVSDGVILKENLHRIGRNDKWLSEQAKQRGFSTLDNIFLIIADKNGITYSLEKE